MNRSLFRVHRSSFIVGSSSLRMETLPGRSEMPTIKVVGVLGCGLMGSGIAQVAAQAGYKTIVREVAEPLIEKGKAGIAKSLDKFVEKGKLSAGDRDSVLQRFTFTTKVADLKPCDIVIEAVTEDLE